MNTSDLSLASSISASSSVKDALPWYRRKITWIAGSLALPILGATLWAARNIPSGVVTSQSTLTLNLKQPDAWIHSKNLSNLPKALLTIPLLKSLLTEDFLYFYETDEDWLSLQGSFRRISYEHQLRWQDQLLQTLANAPTDIYLWQDSSGALRYWALSVERDTLVTVAQHLAQIKLNNDKQLRQVGDLKVDGNTLPILQIRLSSRRTMIMAAYGKRLALLADANMVYDDKGHLNDEGKTLLKTLLTSSEVQSLGRDLGTGAPSEQRIGLSQRVLFQNYHGFTPQVQAMQWDFTGSQWKGQAKLAEGSPTPPPLWQHAPAQAAWCLQGTIDWKHVQKAMPSSDKHFQLDGLFAPSGLACWYANGRIQQPLLITQRQTTASSDEKKIHEIMQQLFDWHLSHDKAYLKDVLSVSSTVKGIKNTLYAAETRRTQLEATLDAFDFKGWEKRKKEQQTQMELIETQWKEQKKLKSEVSSDEWKFIEETHERTMKESQEQAKQLNDEPKLYKKQIQEDLDATEKTIQSSKNELKQQEAILRDQQTLASTQSGPYKALSIKKQGDLTTMTRKIPITKKINPMLAYSEKAGGPVYFSIDAQTVKQALDVAQHRFPSLAESAQRAVGKGVVYWYMNPKETSKVIQKEAEIALAKDQPNRYQAFNQHIPKRLADASKHTEWGLGVSKNASGWQVLHWNQ